MVKEVTPCLFVGHIPRKKVELSVESHYRSQIIAQHVKQDKAEQRTERSPSPSVMLLKSTPASSNKMLACMFGDRPVNEL